MFGSKPRAPAYALLIACTGFLGCGEASTHEIQDQDIVGPTIELTGQWRASSGEVASIDNEMWGLDAIQEFDNEDNFAITRTAATAAQGAGKFNKIVWTDIVNNSFHACYALFGYDNIDALQAATFEVDSTDPQQGGCNGFPWFFFTRENPGPAPADAHGSEDGL